MPSSVIGSAGVVTGATFIADTGDDDSQLSFDDKLPAFIASKCFFACFADWIISENLFAIANSNVCIGIRHQN
jgi:hypothetical protein